MFVVVVVIIFLCDSVCMLFTHRDTECVWSVVCRYRPSSVQFPIIVSQDCRHAQTANVIQSYGTKLTHIEVHCTLSPLIACVSQLNFYLTVTFTPVGCRVLQSVCLSVSVCLSLAYVNKLAAVNSNLAASAATWSASRIVTLSDHPMQHW